MQDDSHPWLMLAKGSLLLQRRQVGPADTPTEAPVLKPQAWFTDVQSEGAGSRLSWKCNCLQRLLLEPLWAMWAQSGCAC